MRNLISTILFCVVLPLIVKAQSLPLSVKAPNNKLSYTVILNQEKNNELSYTLHYKDNQVILSSSLGVVCNGRHWGENLRLVDLSTQSRDSSWTPMYGEREIVHNTYNETTFTFINENGREREFQLIVRAYDTGIAFRYCFPESPKSRAYLTVNDENTEFTFPESTKAWFTPTSQGDYHLLPLKNWSGDSERPLTLELTNNLFVCLAEAEMVNYSRTNLKLNKKQSKYSCMLNVWEC